MLIGKYKKSKLFPFLILLIILVLYLFFFYFITKNFQKEEKLSLEPISINLLTSVHPNLNWNFKSVKSEISIKPGDVTTVEYIVENLGVTDSVGIATFAYYPKTISSYVRKINCFCYDAQTLKAKEKK